MKDSELIQYEGGLVKRVGNAISITSKLLSVVEPRLIPYRKDDKWGFCVADKTIVIDCIYDYTYNFEELASVKKNGKYGCIDKKGNVIIPCIYDDVFSF